MRGPVRVVESVAPLLLLVTFVACKQLGQEHDDFEAKNKCADRAQAYLSHWREEEAKLSDRWREKGYERSDRSMSNEQFTYNKSLNTCLVYFEAVAPGSGISYNIADTLTNRTLYHHLKSLDPKMQESWDRDCKQKTGCLGEPAFQKKRVELFGN